MGSRTTYWAPETDPQRAWGLSADLLHSCPNLARHRHSIIDHRVMSPSKSKLLSSYTLSSQGFLQLVLESVFSGPQVQFKSEYQYFYCVLFFNSIQDISNSFYRRLQCPPSTQHLSSFLMPIRPLPTISNPLPSYHHSSMPPWVLSMAPMSIAPRLPKSAAHGGTTKVFSHRIASLRVPLTSVSPTCCLDGRGQPLIPPFSTMHAKSTCLFLRGDTTLQTPVFPHATRFSSLTGTSGIICMSGKHGKSRCVISFLANLLD
jgi:hypothetical protein